MFTGSDGPVGDDGLLGKGLVDTGETTGVAGFDAEEAIGVFGGKPIFVGEPALVGVAKLTGTAFDGIGELVDVG